MNIFYLGKHRKRKVYPLLQQIKLILHLVWLDIKWYGKWWKKLMGDIYHSLNTLSITMIDKWDMFYDEFIRKVIKCILLLYITITINLQSFIITNRTEIGKLAWIEFLQTPQPLIYTMPLLMNS